MPIWIYLLRDPRTSEPRYVGRSRHPMTRLRQHIGYSSSRVSAWVGELAGAGLQPEIELIIETTEDQADQIEKDWIVSLSSQYPLLNVQHCPQQDEQVAPLSCVEKLYTVKEVATHFRVSRQAVYDWIAAGKLRALRIGERVRIPDSAVREFVRTIEPGERVEENEPGPWVPVLLVAA